MRGFKLLGVSALGLVSLLCLTGCDSEKTLTCTNSDEQSGIKMTQEVVMTFKNDKISKLRMTMDNKATNDTIKDNWDMFASILEEQFEPTDKDGVKLTTNNDSDNHSFEIVIDVDLSKASEEDLATYSLDGLADADSTLEETRSAAEEDGFTCK